MQSFYRPPPVSNTPSKTRGIHKLVNAVIEEPADVLGFFLGEVFPAGLRRGFEVGVVGGQAGRATAERAKDLLRDLLRIVTGNGTFSPTGALRKMRFSRDWRTIGTL